MMKRVVLFILLLFALICPSMAAIGEVRAAIDTPFVVVGMPRILHLEVSVPNGSAVEWPHLQREGGFRANDMEDAEATYLLEFGPDTHFDIDTLSASSDLVTLSQDLQFFAFDSAAMVVKPFTFVVNGTDTLQTDQLALRCDHPFEAIPDTPESISDFKDILEPPFVLWDYLRWVVYSILILLALGFVVWLIIYLVNHQKPKLSTAVVAEAPVGPAHIIAMNALLDLEQKHLWESGRFKEFHTELTDIIRRYLERRYGIQAMESTTDEIMEELVELQIHQRSSFNNLKEVLQMADLVKFAKYEPLAEENQMSFNNSRLFVEQTKEMIVDHKLEETVEAVESEKNIKSSNL